MIDRIVQHPYRGLIYDRRKKLLVYNTPVYNLHIVPHKALPLDIPRLAGLLNLPPQALEEQIGQAKQKAPKKPSLLVEGLYAEDFAHVQEDLVEFPGLHVRTRSLREYRGPHLASALGYIGAISPERLEADQENYYATGDNIGISGLEAQYEWALRGEKGERFSMVNASGEELGAFQGGSYDTPSVPGQSITLGIDGQLQTYAETLMKDKTGSIVAIKPTTGEILVFVSAPSYDPNQLRGRNFEAYYQTLTQKKEDPIFIRPTMAQYRPGSTFKVALALAALQEGVITPDSVFPCDTRIINCHPHGAQEDLLGAITHSCNPYFFRVMERLVLQGKKENAFEDAAAGLAVWRDYMLSFGFGDKLGIDFPHEKGGYIPGPSYYDGVYGKNRWSYLTIYSLSIGEGENLIIPLQMANFSCIIANRGHYYTPHFVAHIGGVSQAARYKKKHRVPIKREHFERIAQAMRGVVLEGTGRWRANLPEVSVCGKTGSVDTRRGIGALGFHFLRTHGGTRDCALCVCGRRRGRRRHGGGHQRSVDRKAPKRRGGTSADGGLR